MNSNTEQLQIFDFEIIKHKIPKNLYKNDLFEKSIKNIIELSKDFSPIESCGKAFSTCNRTLEWNLSNLKNYESLFDYISQIIVKNYYNNKVKKILYKRIWVNIMFKECHVKCHVHDGESEGTAIFYYDVPENGSQLLIMKEDIGLKEVTEEYKDITEYVKVESGDLIIHPNNVPHAVSKHMNSNPRICVVFDFISTKQEELIQYY